MTTPKRTPAETWAALEKQAREDRISRFLAKPASAVNASLRASGLDPAAVRAEGTALAKKLMANRDRLAWQVTAAEGLARDQARFAARTPKYASLSRADLEARVVVAKRDPRFAQPAAVMFRNKSASEATDEELRAILEELDALAEGSGGDE